MRPSVNGCELFGPGKARLLTPAAFCVFAPLVVGAKLEGRDGRRSPLVVQRYIDKVGAIGMDDFAGEQVLGLHAELYLHAGCSDVGDDAVNQQELADQYGPMEGDAVYGDGD